MNERSRRATRGCELLLFGRMKTNIFGKGVERGIEIKKNGMKWRRILNQQFCYLFLIRLMMQRSSANSQQHTEFEMLRDENENRLS